MGTIMMACGMYAAVFMLIFFAGKMWDFLWNRLIEPVGVKLGWMKPGQFDCDPRKVGQATRGTAREGGARVRVGIGVRLSRRPNLTPLDFDRRRKW